MIWGSRLSLYVGLTSVLFGITFGALGHGHRRTGGRRRRVEPAHVDTLMALPPIILALSLMAALGQSVNNVILSLTVLLVPTAARTLRSQTLSVKESAFAEAARAAGCRDGGVIASTSCRTSSPPTSSSSPSTLLRDRRRSVAFVPRARGTARRALVGGHAHGGDSIPRAGAVDVPLPGLAISLTVFGLNLFGDATAT